tara:strand:+ start:130 stop:552 length:423 start_codon:yes stop_codon:yes gene_type:complete
MKKGDLKMQKKPIKYNHDNKNHRRWLAERLFKVLVGFGYVVDFDNKFPEQIFLKRYPMVGRVVKVYTSVDKRSSEARRRGVDAIRVCVIEEKGHNPKQPFLPSHCLYIKRINRTGTINSIADRLVRAIREAEKKACRRYF